MQYSAVSLVFYDFGEPVYIFLMIFTVAADYRLSSKIKTVPKSKGRCDLRRG